MNIELVIAPAVRNFVLAVRARLRDLPIEDQQELVEGLEADLADLVAEQGSEVLSDPDAYARELRIAAGFSPDPAPIKESASVAQHVNAVLDAARQRWLALASGLPGDPWGLLVALRPAWWVLRVWVALQLADLIWGGGTRDLGLSVVPSLGSLGWPLLILGIVVSVQIGRGKIWPGRPLGGTFGRVALLGLNCLAIACVPWTFTSVFTPAKAAGWGWSYATGEQVSAVNPDSDRAGIFADGKWISQIYPYDAAGKPLVGVQLFDQEGAPIKLVTQTECVYDAQGNWIQNQGRVYYPWTNGATQQQNVVPVPSVIPVEDVPDPDPQAFAREVKPTIGQFPFVKVPPVSLPGLKVSESSTPKGAFVPGDKPKVPINGIDQGC